MEREKHVQSRWPDVKNLVIGLLLGICLMLAIAAAGSSRGDIGTFQCCAAGDDSLAVFVIDTRTGQTWRLGRIDAYDLGSPGTPKSVRHSVTPYVN